MKSLINSTQVSFQSFKGVSKTVPEVLMKELVLRTLTLFFTRKGCKSPPSLPPPPPPQEI